MTVQNDTSRRDFLTGSTAALAAAAFAGGAYAGGSDAVKVGIIGCGGRGTGAGEDVLRAAKGVTIVAMGDAFKDRLDGSRKHLEKYAREEESVTKLGNTVDVGERAWHGLDAFEKVIGSAADYIILATPPGFRPLHIEAVVKAGKNLFTEKPVGVDGPGLRKVFAAYDASKEKKLGIAAGTQRRHQSGYREVMKRIHGGEIGEFAGGACYWNQGILWSVKREKGWTDLQAQMRNWYNYTWLCGDHIVEQHVHNIDVINWAAPMHPKECIGMGYRTRTNPDFGHIYDFFAVDYIYPNGAHVASLCRQISECYNSISEEITGTKGNARTADRSRYDVNGKRVFDPRRDNRPYIQEHTDLIESIRKGEPINELKNVAESTLTAIMGRMSAYTGQKITWEQALNSKEVLMPEGLAWDMKLPTPPVAMPGKTPFK
ncbi:MAG: Gfo/Idh/MocA family oxidoreductase [Gemmataceae bacterium]|nr:Gfo/Idh/MocA family oxidoreductase [Gemmataceae bacterium]